MNPPTLAIYAERDLDLMGLTATLSTARVEIVVASRDEAAVRAAIDARDVDLVLCSMSSAARAQQLEPFGTRTVMIVPSVSTVAARLIDRPDAAGVIVADLAGDYLSSLVLTALGGGVVIDERIRTVSLSPLSAREEEILGRLAMGESNTEISDGLSLSPHTVKEYVSKILRKLHARTRAEAVARAVGCGLLESPELFRVAA